MAVGAGALAAALAAWTLAPGAPADARGGGSGTGPAPASAAPATRAARELAAVLDALREGRHPAALAGMVALLSRPGWEELEAASATALEDARLDLVRWALEEAEELARAGEGDAAAALLARAERCLAGLPADGDIDAARARIRGLLAVLEERRRVVPAVEDTLAPEIARVRELGARDPAAGLAEVEKALAAEKDPARRRRWAAEAEALRAAQAGRARRARLRQKADAAVRKGDFQSAGRFLADAIQDAKGDPTAAADEAAKDAERKAGLEDLEENGEPPVLAAVRTALRWVVKQQLPDGSFGWTAVEEKEKGLPEGKRNSHPQIQGLTALAGLALVGHARHDFTDEFEAPLDRALDWILSRQRKDGSFPGSMYDHAISTLLLVDADRYLVRPRVRAAVPGALLFLQDARNTDGGWRYQPRSGGSDVSVTGWASQALLHAHLGRWEVPQEVLDGALSYIDRMTDPAGRVGYTDPGRGTLAMTATALFCRLRFGQGLVDERVRAAADLLAASPPKPGWKETSYHLFYASDAMSRLGGTYWKQWGPALKKYLLDAQVKEGDAAGAWPSAGDRWAERTGSIYLAAMHALALENFFEHRE